MIISIDKKSRIKHGNYLDTTPEKEARMLSLSEYQKMAERCICRYAPPGLARKMMQDEDAISLVAEGIMQATCSFDPNRPGKHLSGKSATLATHHINGARYAINKWCQAYAKKGRRYKNFRSLDEQIDTHTDEGVPLYATVADKNCVDPLVSMVEEETIKQIKDDAERFLSLIPPRQRECVELVVIDGVKQSVVSQQLGISRQAVQQSLGKAFRTFSEFSNYKVYQRP